MSVAETGRMNKNVGASFTLSVLVVLFFAVALYQPESRTPKAAAKPAEGQPSAKGGGGLAVASPDHESSKTNPSAPSPSGAVTPQPSRPVVTASNRRAQTPRIESPPTVARTIPVHRPTIREPGKRGAFTSVLEGETLADVASRVYGMQGDANVLWMANRDLVDRKDARLHPGMILRTP
jgi:hypothetical protein